MKKSRKRSHLVASFLEAVVMRVLSVVHTAGKLDGAVVARRVPAWVGKQVEV